MVNQEHLQLLQRSIKDWNVWRAEHPTIVIDFSNVTLSRADLSRADLNEANLIGADLSNANLIGVKLREANLTGADLREANLNYACLPGADFTNADLSNANLSNANLSEANLSNADLSEADLSNAYLRETNLSKANLSGANLSNACIGGTHFANVDLRTVKELETVKHIGPSTIGTDTIVRSQGDIPESFLQGAGLSDSFINYARSLVGHPIEYYTCFISYSSKDQEFVERLYADLQSKEVRCWFAPEDLKTGDKIRDRIDQSIRLHDKLLLVLSQHSVNSSWVEFEAEAAIAKENNKNTLMLFPIRLDSAVKDSPTSWAAHIRRTRHITDFSNWKQHDAYQKVLKRLLRDLKQETPPTADQH